MTRGLPAEAIQRAVTAMRQGALIILVDDEDRENEADLVLAAEFATTERMAFLVAHTTGIVCVPLTAERADRLALPQMVEHNTDAHGTAFTVSADHRSTGTGVSAADRASTARALADLDTAVTDLRRPGHIFPLQAREGGVLRRAGHTEASVDLLRIAGLSPVAVISELVAADGSMMAGAAVTEFAAEHDLVVLHIADVVKYRRATERLVEPVASAALPTHYGEFRAIAYRSALDGSEHLALTMGDVADMGRCSPGVLVRVHSECLTGDVLGSLRCDCGSQLEQALQAIAAEGCGIVVYLRGHEGRGIGLAHKIRAYALQEQGFDTVDANVAQGLPVDSRSYGVGAQILGDLGVRRMRLITNNPAKYGGLGGYGLEIVSRVSLPNVATPYNVKYLQTKRDRLGHSLELREPVQL
jgi:3,4-dihydroxy 2-butanone 4-phosphate synthase / GTP cyclohydrolase II